MEKKETEVFIHDYDCPYCKNQFKARSGSYNPNRDQNKQMLKNLVKCPKCANGLKNKA